jgi:CheY-like chemotaxis protein
MLEKMGHSVQVAGNGREAVAALARAAFDVVLMDVQMPDMDGFEATASIRAQEAHTGGHVRVIGLTAHAFQDDRERCLASGMDGYVTKPVRAAELFAALEGQDVGAPEAPPAAAGFDEAEALASVGGERGLLAFRIEQFLAESPRALAALQQAIARQDAEAVRGAAHKFQGNIAFSRAGQLAARRLERLAASGALDGAAELLAALRAVVEPLEESLRRGLSANGAAPP